MKRYSKLLLLLLVMERRNARYHHSVKKARADDPTIKGTKVLKCIEGHFNLLTMDNGIEVLAKLPNPNAGPAFYTTASEVATLKFVSYQSSQNRIISTEDSFFPCLLILTTIIGSHSP